MSNHPSIPEAELRAFIEKVEKLKREGMTITDIARRLGLHRNTVNARLRLAKQRQST